VRSKSESGAEILLALNVDKQPKDKNTEGEGSPKERKRGIFRRFINLFRSDKKDDKQEDSLLFKDDTPDKTKPSTLQRIDPKSGDNELASNDEEKDEGGKIYKHIFIFIKSYQKFCSDIKDIQIFNKILQSL